MQDVDKNMARPCVPGVGQADTGDDGALLFESGICIVKSALKVGGPFIGLVDTGLEAGDLVEGVAAVLFGGVTLPKYALKLVLKIADLVPRYTSSVLGALFVCAWAAAEWAQLLIDPYEHQAETPSHEVVVRLQVAIPLDEPAPDDGNPRPEYT